MSPPTRTAHSAIITVQEVTSIRTPGPSAPERPDIEAQDLLVIIAAIELLRRGMQLRSCQLTLLTSLAFGAVLAVFSAPLTAQTTTIPNLSGYDSETRRTKPPASKSAGANSEQSRRGETDVHSFFGMSRFTTENIMKVHQGMGSNEILEMFGAPKNVSQSVCGASVGTPWTCTTWQFGEFPYDWASFTFAGDSDSLILNNFNVHKF